MDASPVSTGSYDGRRNYLGQAASTIPRHPPPSDLEAMFHDYLQGALTQAKT
jgi:hypothetical protein